MGETLTCFAESLILCAVAFGVMFAASDFSGATDFGATVFAIAIEMSSCFAEALNFDEVAFGVVAAASDFSGTSDFETIFGIAVETSTCFAEASNFGAAAFVVVAAAFEISFSCVGAYDFCLANFGVATATIFPGATVFVAVPFFAEAVFDFTSPEKQTAGAVAEV